MSPPRRPGRPWSPLAPVCRRCRRPRRRRRPSSPWSWRVPGGQEGHRHQGGPRAHRPGPEGSQGPGRGRSRHGEGRGLGGRRRPSMKKKLGARSSSNRGASKVDIQPARSDVGLPTATAARSSPRRASPVRSRFCDSLLGSHPKGQVTMATRSPRRSASARTSASRTAVLETPYLLAIQVDSTASSCRQTAVEGARPTIGLHAAFKKSVFPIRATPATPCSSTSATASASRCSTS